jgi:membrane-bound serine protease (ClpP class)
VRLRAAALLTAACALLAAVWPAASARAEGPEAARHKAVRVVDFEGEIEAALAAFVQRRLEASKQAGDDCLVLRIDSPGGTVHHSEELANAILALPKSMRTVAWVKERALSGAAMVALACDEIVMGPKATLGDCQPILMGAEGIVPVGEKIETVLRAEFRKYAEDNGWPVLLAEKMVSKDMEVIRVRDETTGKVHLADGAEFASARDDDLVAGIPKRDLRRLDVVVGKDRLLTLTTTEAQRHGFVKRVFSEEPALLAALQGEGARLTVDEMSFSERTGRWLLNFTGVLSALALLCAGLSIFRGIGTATIVGIVAVLLLVLVTATADLANGFALLLVGVGVLALLAEAFLIPGFGFAGILGIVSTVVGLLFLVSETTLESPGTLSWASASTFLLQVVLTLAVGIAFLVVLMRVFPSLPGVQGRMILAGDTGSAGAAVPPRTWTPAAGVTGLADTDLRPAGRALIGGHNVDVTSEGGFVAAGSAVRVLRVEGARVVVRPC